MEEAPPQPNLEKSASTRRTVRLSHEDGSIVGAWAITCDECPLKPHLEALGMKPQPCTAGIQTNMQGYVPLKDCKHYEKDSIKLEGKTLTLTCRKTATA